MIYWRRLMLPWVHIDTGKIPGGEGDLRLLSRGTEFAIFLDRAELMNSRRSASEEALATLTCTRLTHQPTARVLIGGLGNTEERRVGKGSGMAGKCRGRPNH